MRVRRLAEGEGLPLPSYMSGGAAGADLYAARDTPLAPGERALVPTGIAIEVPPGFEAQVRPRSGLALNDGLTVLNAPGTIDADYRGPLGVILVNLGARPVVVRRGDRIAQLVVAPVSRAAFVETDALAPTERGEGGFGSSGRA